MKLKQTLWAVGGVIALLFALWKARNEPDPLKDYFEETHMGGNR